MDDDKRKDAEYISANPVTGWRLWLFRFLAATLIPALLFMLIELSLRIVGYGHPTTVTIKTKLFGKDAYSNNFQYSWRFLPQSVTREADPIIFPAKKSSNTYRIFVLSGSAARGTPDSSISFSRILQRMLQQQYPSVNFEVINTAIVAINSHVVLETAKGYADHQPDLFIVYLGNNEVAGPFGSGDIGKPFSNLSVIRASLALKATRLGQLLMNLGRSVGAQKNISKAKTGMGVFGGHQVRADNPGLETIYRNFQRNLEDISRVALESGAKIIFSTVGANLKDNPPFSSMHRIGLTDGQLKNWDEIYRQGITYETSGEYDKAVQQYLLAAEIDDSFADLQFRLGRRYWSMEDFEKARDRYVKARRLDTLRLRADSRINEIITNVASGRSSDGVYFTDAVKAFEKISPHNTPGEELFYEHVHLNFRGNCALAKAFFTQAEEILPERIKSKKAKKLPLLTIEQCAEDLAYTDHERYKIARAVLTSFFMGAPFTNQLYHDQQVRHIENKISQLKVYAGSSALQEALVKYFMAVQKSPSDWQLRLKYGLALETLGRDLAAVEQYKLLLDHTPNCYSAYGRLTLIMTKNGRLDEAVRYGSKALEIHPTSAILYSYLAKVYQKKKMFDLAEKCHSKAIYYEPSHIPAYLGLGFVLSKQGKLDEAVEILRKGLLYAPDSLNLRHKIGVTLKKQGHTKQAAEEFRAALKLHPESKVLRKALSSCEELLRSQEVKGDI